MSGLNYNRYRSYRLCEIKKREGKLVYEDEFDK
jgi:hypothetical protein